MPAENKINISIPPEVLTEVKAALQTIKTKLEPYLIALTPAERQELPKMSDKTFPFVMKVLSYVDSSPQFSPPYLDVPSLKIDMKAVEDMRGLFEKDDFNDHPVPYSFVRPGGRHGSCYANTYKHGTEYLLFIKKTSEGYTVNIDPLAPVNEQLHSSEDPWLYYIKGLLNGLKGMGNINK